VEEKRRRGEEEILFSIIKVKVGFNRIDTKSPPLLFSSSFSNPQVHLKSRKVVRQVFFKDNYLLSNHKIF